MHFQVFRQFTGRSAAIVLLNLATQTCTTSLADLSQSNRDESHPSLAVVYTDLMSLLSLIYASTTKLSIALNPSSPTYQASLSPLKDLIAHISGIAHCVSLLHPHEYGTTLRREVQGTVREIIESVRELVHTFLRPNTSDSKRDEYLVRTGEIHDLIQRARNGMSKNNLAAVRKMWDLDRSALEDGFREVGKMIEEEEGEENAEELGFDDGWGELGLHESGKKMNKEELKRTKDVSIHEIDVFTLLSKLTRCIPSSVLQLFYTNASSLTSFLRPHRQYRAQL